MAHQTPRFELQIIENREVIKIIDTALFITIYRLGENPFKADNNKIILYGDDNGVHLAFETTGWNSQTFDEHLVLIGLAIAWYAEIIGNTQMQLSVIDPRPNQNLIN